MTETVTISLDDLDEDQWKALAELVDATMQYLLPLLYWPGYTHVRTEVAQWEQDFIHGGRK